MPIDLNAVLNAELATPIVFIPGQPIRCACCNNILVGADGDWTHKCPPWPEDAKVVKMVYEVAD